VSDVPSGLNLTPLKEIKIKEAKQNNVASKHAAESLVPCKDAPLPKTTAVCGIMQKCDDFGLARHFGRAEYCSLLILKRILQCTGRVCVCVCVCVRERERERERTNRHMHEN
jgi:hypothetical protein